MTQWKEEVEILEEELKRTQAFFGKMSENWKTLAAKEASKKRGYAEYALQKSDMNARRSSEAKFKLAAALAVDITKTEDPKKRKQPED